MISVAEARARILAGLEPVGAEIVALSEAAGRVLATAVMARRTQPPVPVSAMDGYALRAADAAEVPVALTQVGTSQAGRAHEGQVGAGQCVRIFTGAPMPAGADCVVIQEDTATEGRKITIREAPKQGQFVRRAGLDFRAGDVLLRGGMRLGPAQIGLAAAMDVPWLEVRRRPRVALISTGDELVRPGEPAGPAQIVSSNALALSAMVRAAGGEPLDLGIARDERASILALVDAAAGCDLLVTLGGASVGEHDLVQKALSERGLALDFWKIAMRPGKPLMSGRLGAMPMLGFPGNPVSSLVCGLLFLKPAIAALLGLKEPARPLTRARLGRDLPANDSREDYLRASLAFDEDGTATATPFNRQDSSNLSKLAEAQCLVIRPPHAPEAKAGEPVAILLLTEGSHL